MKNIKRLGGIAVAILAIGALAFAITDTRYQTKIDAAADQKESKTDMDAVKLDMKEYRTDMKWVRENLVEIKAAIKK